MTVIAVFSVCAAWVAIFVSVANGCVSVTDVFLLNTIFGKFDCFLGFDDKSSRASITFTVGRGVVTVLCYFVAGFPLWHPGSDNLPSLSDEPRHLISFLPGTSRVFTSYGRRTPLNPFQSAFRLICSCL